LAIISLFRVFDLAEPSSHPVWHLAYTVRSFGKTVATPGEWILQVSYLVNRSWSRK